MASGFLGTAMRRRRATDLLDRSESFTESQPESESGPYPPPWMSSRAAPPPMTEVVEPQASAALVRQHPTAAVRVSADPYAPAPPLRSYSRSYGRYEDEREALPTEEAYVQQRTPRGVKQRVLSSLKLGGKFLVHSGLNPLAALEGAVIGAADKNSNARFDYRTQVEPRSFQRQKQYLGQAQDELGLEDRRQVGLIRQHTMQRQQDEDTYQRTVRRPLEDALTQSQIRENEAQADAARRNKNVPQHWQRIQDAQTGEYIFFDPGSGQRVNSGVRGTLREPSVPAYAADPDPPDFDSEIKKRMDQWREGHFGTLGITPEIREKAKDPSLNPAEAGAVRQAENELYQRAKDSVAADANKRKAQGHFQRQKPGGGGRAPAGGKSGKVPVITAAKIPEAARRKNMTEDQFRAWFTQNGGVVQ